MPLSTPVVSRGRSLIAAKSQGRSRCPTTKGRRINEKIRATPDPEPLVTFAEAVKTRKQPGGHAEAAHRAVTLLHLANLAIRTGRKIRYDPVKEQAIGDEEANRLINQPMRAPWHL